MNGEDFAAEDALRKGLNETIEERTEARAGEFRAQERVRELEALLEPLGHALLDLRRVSLAIREAPPEASERLRDERMNVYSTVRRCEQAIAPEAVKIATKRREGK